MISFIIPVYNKALILDRTLSSLQKHLSQNHLADYEIIVVNDGSTDASFSEAVKFKHKQGFDSRIKIYHYTKNIGKGFALKFGFKQSLGDPVVFLDGDMDIDTKQIIGAIKAYQQHRPDMVIGSKYAKASRFHYPLIRYFYSLALRFINRSLFHLSVSDTQVGLKVFQREVLTAVFPKLIIKRFAVDLELLVVATMLGYKSIFEIPVVIKHTSANHSTIDVWAVKNFCLDILAIFYRKQILHYYSLKEEVISPNFSFQAV